MTKNTNSGRTNLKNRINLQLGTLASAVKINSAENRNDLAVDTENTVCGLLNMIFGWNLVNANVTEHPKFPAVDLIDRGAGIAVQVTAQNTLKKVDEMLSQFKEHKMNREYTKLILLVLTDKDPTDTMLDREDMCFYGHRDIWNLKKLAQNMENKSIDQLEKIAEYLDKEIGLLTSGQSDQSHEDANEHNENENGRKNNETDKPATETSGSFRKGDYPDNAEENDEGYEEEDYYGPNLLERIDDWFYAWFGEYNQFAIAVVIVICMLVGIGIVCDVVMEDKPIEEMPQELSGYSLTINDKRISLPVGFETLEEMGWICVNPKDNEKRIEPESDGHVTTLTNGNGEITVTYGNPSGHTLTVQECVIYKIDIDASAFDDSYTGDTINVLEGPLGITMSETLWSEVQWPVGYDRDRNEYTITYEYFTGDSNRVLFVFSRDSKQLISLVIVNQDENAMKVLTENGYDTQPSEFDQNAVDQYLGAKMKFEVDKYLLPVGVIVSTYEDMNYTLDKVSKAVTSGKYGELFVRCDALNRLEGTIYNPYLRAMTYEYCFVGSLRGSDMKSTDGSYIFVCDTADGSLIIPKGTDRTELIKKLDELGMAWHFEEENSIVVFPNPTNRDVWFECTISSDSGKVVDIEADVCEALRKFFFGEV